MKDITSTSFGLVIAFLLPGLTGLGGLAFWSTDIGNILKTFLTTESNIGLFFLVMLVGLAFGLEVTLLRWLLFEKWVCSENSLNPEDFKNLADEKKLLAFKAVVDEHYRYHQFWGGIFLVNFIIYPGLINFYWQNQTTPKDQVIFFLLSFATFISIQVLTFLGAKASYNKYVIRGKKILEG